MKTNPKELVSVLEEGALSPLLLLEPKSAPDRDTRDIWVVHKHCEACEGTSLMSLRVHYFHESRNRGRKVVRRVHRPIMEDLILTTRMLSDMRVLQATGLAQSRLRMPAGDGEDD